MKSPPVAAVDWCKAGKYFSWKSTLAENAASGPLNIFSLCRGNPQSPAILLIHGYPTSSYDFYKLVGLLTQDFYVCLLDTPGYGFSDKPRHGYRYSVFDDARLVDDFIRKVINLRNFTLVTHDKGDSVGLALLQIYQSRALKPYIINHQIILNGNIYLPLAQLNIGQKLLLNHITGPVMSALMTGSQMARGLARTTYSPTLPAEEVEALVSIFNYQSGMKIQHDIIQYLNERKANEIVWLEALGRSEVPAMLIWGELDSIAPPAVADYVWSNYLKGRAVPASYWRVPCANHYVQFDQPEIVAALIRSAVKPGSGISNITNAGCQPYQIK